MNPYHSLTDEQLAEWHRLTTKCDQLEQAIVIIRKETEGAQALLTEENRTLRAELNRRGDKLAEVAMKEIHAMSSLRSTTGALFETLRAVRRLLAAIEQCDKTGWCAGARDVLTKIIAEATEVVHKYDIPF